jgi:hypothetical protein
MTIDSLPKRARCAPTPDFLSELCFEQTSNISSFLNMKDFFSYMTTSKEFNEERKKQIQDAQDNFNPRDTDITELALPVLFYLDLSRLTKLNLSGRKLTDSLLKILLDKSFSFNALELDLSKNLISNKSSLNLNWKHALDGFPSLVRLNLAETLIDTDGVLAIAAAKMTPPSLEIQLTHLNVEACDNINQSAKILLRNRVAEKNPQLQLIL